jgi:hypothetical protein
MMTGASAFRALVSRENHACPAQNDPGPNFFSAEAPNIYLITGLALQDDIAARALFLLNRGRDILRMVPGGPSLQNNENHIDSVLQAAPARASPGCQA